MKLIQPLLAGNEEPHAFYHLLAQLHVFVGRLGQLLEVVLFRLVFSLVDTSSGEGFVGLEHLFNDLLVPSHKIVRFLLQRRKALQRRRHHLSTDNEEGWSVSSLWVGIGILVVLVDQLKIYLSTCSGGVLFAYMMAETSSSFTVDERTSSSSSVPAGALSNCTD